MAAPYIVLNVTCKPEVENKIETALNNAGIRFQTKQLDEGYQIFIPNIFAVLALTLNILHGLINELDGSIVTPTGEQYELSAEGLEQFKDILNDKLFEDREIVPSTPSDISIRDRTLLDYTPEQWSSFIETVGTVWTQVKTAGSKEKKQLSYPVFGLVAVIFVGFIWLASKKLIDSQSITFLFGIIIGSLIPFLREFIIPETQ